MERTFFEVDGRFMVFLVVMTMLFILFGIVLTPGSFVPMNFETFW
jgi:hypothetical protein